MTTDTDRSVRIDPDTHKQLRLEAAKTGATIRELIAAAVAAYLKGGKR